MTTYSGMSYGNSSTLAGIREDIYFIGQCNASFISANDLNRIINKYYAQVQEVIRGVNENFYLTEATSDLVIGDGTYTFPDGTGTAPQYEKIKSIWASFQPATPSSPLTTEFQRVNIVDPDSISDPSYTFTQPTALVFGTYFTLLPLVTDVTLYPVTGGVKMYYIPTQNQLVNDTDVPLVFPSFRDAITHGSLIDIAERLGDENLKKDSIANFKKRLEDIAVYASTRVPDEIGIVEGQDDQGGWDFPFGKQSMS